MFDLQRKRFVRVILFGHGCSHYKETLSDLRSLGFSTLFHITSPKLALSGLLYLHDLRIGVFPTDLMYFHFGKTCFIVAKYIWHETCHLYILWNVVQLALHLAKVVDFI